jgi:hypothetical protein
MFFCLGSSAMVIFFPAAGDADDDDCVEAVDDPDSFDSHPAISAQASSRSEIFRMDSI